MPLSEGQCRDQSRRVFLDTVSNQIKEHRMSLKKVFLTFASLFVLSVPGRAQVNEEFQRYAAALQESLNNLDAARAYLKSHSLLDARFEKELGAAKGNILLSSFNLGQWILPGISYEDRRSRLNVFCEYNYEARQSWRRMNRDLLGPEHNQDPEWVSLFSKSTKDLPMPCD